MMATECCSCMSQRGVDQDACPDPADGGCKGGAAAGLGPGVFYNNNIGQCTAQQVMESDSRDFVAGTFVWSGCVTLLYHYCTTILPLLYIRTTIVPLLYTIVSLLYCSPCVCFLKDRNSRCCLHVHLTLVCLTAPHACVEGSTITGRHVGSRRTQSVAGRCLMWQVSSRRLRTGSGVTAFVSALAFAFAFCVLRFASRVAAVSRGL